jgi:hypothetical protein
LYALTQTNLTSLPGVPPSLHYLDMTNAGDLPKPPRPVVICGPSGVGVSFVLLFFVFIRLRSRVVIFNVGDNSIVVSRHSIQ